MKCYHLILIFVISYLCSEKQTYSIPIPVQNNATMEETLLMAAINDTSFENQLRLYINEHASAETKVISDRARQDKDSYYIVVVTVPETTTALPPPQKQSPSLPNTNPTDARQQYLRPRTAAPTPAPSLVNRLGNILLHSLNSNFSGILEESFGAGTSDPVRNAVLQLLGSEYCNTIRRLLGQCTQSEVTTLDSAALEN